MVDESNRVSVDAHTRSWPREDESYLDQMRAILDAASAEGVPVQSSFNIVMAWLKVAKPGLHAKLTRATVEDVQRILASTQPRGTTP